ncbi:twitching motility protein PilT [Planktothricoides sp. SR001]|uniref:type II toxin-antitoxin system VapC family toxin n=1 Tax=Planktothricoides sp. SR001 TaxID=1705388 RepID=UPI0006C402D6|nr:type II toxin-antitoxin system VapC family toxin [Planktothricoides sp. SR001]KOR36611.1 twitching motility protein PilT [Planktothricoides sp. SR001]
MRISDALAGVTRIYLDTAPVIYLVERHAQFFDRVRGVFRQVDRGQLTVVASPITLAECLVGAYKTQQTQAAIDFMDCLTQESTDFVEISAETGDRAAQLRVKYNLALIDALQIATALVAGCEAFLTNDVQLSRVTELKIILVSELEV